MGPGQDAGAVDVGDGVAVVFKMESHSHPSAVEPYQGAATGVGGIVRDIISMGARPVALSCALILEEGLPAPVLEREIKAMAAAARAAGVTIVTGDTKVVERGRCEGKYGVTTGVGVGAAAAEVGPPRARAGGRGGGSGAPGARRCGAVTVPRVVGAGHSPVEAGRATAPMRQMRAAAPAAPTPGPWAPGRPHPAGDRSGWGAGRSRAGPA